MGNYPFTLVCFLFSLRKIYLIKNVLKLLENEF
jgi:hypothetical protein